MEIPLIETASKHQIFSPFSGQAADGEDGPNDKDPTLLFVYYGDASLYAYVADSILRKLGCDHADSVEDSPEAIAARLDVSGGLALKVDTGWNGVNVYGFAPAD